MLAKRIIPCLDVKAGVVVKGKQFQRHKMVGNIVELAQFYSEQGADELVFYDITASSDGRSVDLTWIEKIACVINIPFCVAGGIRSIERARQILHAGADKISINSPALERPELISELAEAFGRQCIVVGIDACWCNGESWVYQYTGDEHCSRRTAYQAREWAERVQALGAGEVVLNCMNQDGMRQGYDISQLQSLRQILQIPLIASGGAGNMTDFALVFQEAAVDGALAASVFHQEEILIPNLKQYLQDKKIPVRLT